MKKLFLSVAVLCVTLFVQAKDYADYVSPLVGTQSSFELSTGNTYPAISRPWGMNFWTPQTGKMGDGWQYVYTANKIRGFKQTHQPSPWINDYGQFSIMPVTGKPEFEEDKHRQAGSAFLCCGSARLSVPAHPDGVRLSQCAQSDRWL